MQISVSFANTQGVKSFLQIDRKIASGRSNVYHAKSLSHDLRFALKTFAKDNASTNMYKREQRIISLLKHENIIQYFPINEHSLENHILLTEYAPYGDFLDFVKKQGMDDEKLIRTYFHHLIDALEYIHSQGAAHLDLKLENLLIGRNFALKLADFDQSQTIAERNQIHHGTPNYRAPEIKRGECRNFFSADIYSAGIILYAFKTSEFPFSEEGEEMDSSFYGDLFKEDNKEFWQFKAENKGDKEFFSEEFKDLVNGMLSQDPKERLNIEGVKSSTWYSGPIYEKKELKARMEKVVREK